MTAAIASPAQAEASFSYEGAQIHLTCSSAEELQNALARFRIGKAASSANEKTVTPEVKQDTKPTQAEQSGNVASTPQADQGSAQPAATGSTDGAGDAHPYNYNDISARVVAVVKKPNLGREKAAALLKEFGVDHANKLQLDQYVAFIDKADALLAGSAA